MEIGDEFENTKVDRGMIRTYRDLIVWQRSMAFVTETYKSTKSFPREELFGLVSQMRRCAVSIPSNVAERYGRRSKGDYVRFLQLAMGSLFEIQTQLQIAFNLEFMNKPVFDGLLDRSREVERILSALIRKVSVK